MQRIAFLCAGLLLLASCSTGGQELPSGTQSGQTGSNTGAPSGTQPTAAREVSPLSFSGAGLPALPSGHSALALDETRRDGSDTLSASSNSGANGTALDISSSAQELGWAVYELPAADALRYLDIELSIPATSDESQAGVFLALADYSRGAWEIQGPVLSGRVLKLDPQRHAAPGGQLYAAVIASGGASVSVQRLTLLAEHSNSAPTAVLQPDQTGGWQGLTVHFDASGSSDPDAGDSIVRYHWDLDGDNVYEGESTAPLASYQYLQSGVFSAGMVAEDKDGLLSARAAWWITVFANQPPSAQQEPGQISGEVPLTVEFDASASSPGHSLPDSPEDPNDALVLYEWDFEGDGFYDTSAAQPLASHTYESIGQRNAVLRITDKAGNTSTVASSISVSAQINPVHAIGATGDSCPSLLVSGHPAICYWDEPLNTVRFVRALDGQGQYWAEPTDLLAGADSPALADIGGKPAVACRSNTPGDHRLYYIRALNTEGSQWGSPVLADSSNQGGFNCSLCEVGGLPAVSYYDEVGDDLRYVQAADANGASWQASQLLDASGDCGMGSCLALAQGKPLIAYIGEGPGGYDLKLVRALDADGASWQAPQTIDAAGGTGFGASLCVVNGLPAVSYLNLDDPGAAELRFVRAIDVDGTNWGLPQLLAPASQFARRTSLRLIGGYPAVAYSGDGSESCLRYIRAADLSGGSWEQPQQIDSGALSGRFNSLLELPAGPAIAYSDLLHGELKYARGF